VRYIERVKFELSLAQSMQLSIVPEADRIERVETRYGLSIAAHFEPCSELGGDYWTLVEIDDARLAVLLADFSGHGVAAAINTFLLHSLVARTMPANADPAEWLAALNGALHKILPAAISRRPFWAFSISDLASWASRPPARRPPCWRALARRRRLR
jgi:sigma-B regulation protein RsbU (phosphoserine phosphatase)